MQRAWGRSTLGEFEEEPGGECGFSGVSWCRAERERSERSAGARPCRALGGSAGSLDSNSKSSEESGKVSEPRVM